MRLVLTLAIAAGCGHSKLDGSVPCNTQSCGPNQLCSATSAGVDAGVGPDVYYECVTVPADCDIYDCMGDGCSPCIRELCAPTVVYSVKDRQITCLGQ